MKDLYIQQKKHFGGAFVNVTHSTVHVPTIIYYLSRRQGEHIGETFASVFR